MKKQTILVGLFAAIGLVLGWAAEYQLGLTGYYYLTPGAVGTAVGIVVGHIMSKNL